ASYPPPFTGEVSAKRTEGALLFFRPTPARHGERTALIPPHAPSPPHAALRPLAHLARLDRRASDPDVGDYRPGHGRSPDRAGPRRPLALPRRRDRSRASHIPRGDRRADPRSAPRPSPGRSAMDHNPARRRTPALFGELR